jgi:hypothetical protein
MLAKAQQAILDEMPNAAVTIVSDQSSPDGWNSRSLAALAALLDQYGHSSDAAAVRQNASQGQISLQTMRAFLWAGNSVGARYTTHADGTTTSVPIHLGSPSDYTIDADAIMPGVGSMPEFPLDANIGVLPNCGPADMFTGGNTPTTTIVRSATNPLLLLALLGAAGVAGVMLFDAARGNKKW